MRQRVLFHLVAVDGGPVARPSIADHEGSAFHDDPGMVTGDFAAGQMQVAGHAPANAELLFVDRDDASASASVPSRRASGISVIG